MNTLFIDIDTLHALHTGDVVEVRRSYGDPVDGLIGQQPIWRGAVVTDRQSDGAHAHMPFHLDLRFDNDGRTITLYERDMIPQSKRPPDTFGSDRTSAHYHIRRPSRP